MLGSGSSIYNSSCLLRDSMAFVTSSLTIMALALMQWPPSTRRAWGRPYSIHSAWTDLGKPCPLSWTLDGHPYGISGAY